MKKQILKTVFATAMLSTLINCGSSSTPSSSTAAAQAPQKFTDQYPASSPLYVKCVVENKGDQSYPVEFPQVVERVYVNGDPGISVVPIFNNLGTPLSDTRDFVVKTPQYSEKFKHWPEWQWTVWEFDKNKLVAFTKYYIHREQKLMYDAHIVALGEIGKPIQFVDPESKLSFDCTATK